MNDEEQRSGKTDNQRPSLLQYIWNGLSKLVSSDKVPAECEDHEKIVDRPYDYHTDARWEAYLENVFEQFFNTKTSIRPPNLFSKIGHIGEPISLITNYIQAKMSNPGFEKCFVDDYMDREEMRLLVRKQLDFNGYFFANGSILTAKRPMPPNDAVRILSLGDITVDSRESTKILNLILNRAMDILRLQSFGQTYYDATTPVDMPEHSIELLPGFQTTFRQHERDVLLCADVCSIPKRAVSMLQILFDRTGGRYQDACRQEFVGMHVFAHGYERVFEITDIVFDQSSSSISTTVRGYKTYEEYYRDKFNLIIRASRQPVFIARDIITVVDCCPANRNDKSVMIAPEFCYAIGLTNMMRMNLRLMKDIEQHTTMEPPDYVHKLVQLFQSLSNTPECAAILGEWNIQLDPQLVEVTGRILNRPTIKFGDREIQANQMGSWTGESLVMKILQPPGTKLTNWYVISTNSDRDDTQSFLACLQKVAWEMGFDMGCPAPIRIVPAGDAITFLYELEVCAQLNPQFILCVVENYSARSAIMKKSIVDLAIPTQCIFLRAFREQGVTMARNVATQILCKLGGAPWSIQMPLSKVMIIGCDVCPNRSRDPTMAESEKFGAIVATMDLQRRSQFFSAVVSYRNAVDLSQAFVSKVMEALLEFRRIEGQLPDRILLYRDGVEQGETEHVLKHEFQRIHTELMNVYPFDPANKPVKAAFIIVSKPITRLFTKKNGVRNPPPGTVVDDVITLPGRYDFFLISHHVHQGCVSPTEYNVFDRDFGLRPGHLQLLTYMLCHLYYESPRTTSVPAVCQYARKLASLIADQIHQNQMPSQLWKQSLSLYYL